MKTVEFQAYQENTNVKFNFELTEDSNNNQILGTVLNEVFAWVDLQKSVGAKGLKLNQPINIYFMVDGLVFDTGESQKSITQKLKLNTSKKHLFAKRVKAIFDYSIRDINVVSFEDMLAGLE